MTYAEWIEVFLDRCDGRPRGLCHSACCEMKSVFPELVLVPGKVYCDQGEQEHYWLAAPDGAIVDPTASQFTGISCYVPWKPGDEIRVGKCMNCGEEIYGRPEKLGGPPETLCGERCFAEMKASLGG